jgi:dihydroflavonol-4-reductase
MALVIATTLIEAEEQEPLLACVTGGSGFIAGHVCKKLRDAGYRVRATVRSQTAESEKTGFLEKMGVEIVHGADITVEGSFDSALAGCDFVHHCAAPFTFKGSNAAEAAMQGVLNVLHSARKAGTVRRVVLLSSLAAITYADPTSHPKGEAHVWSEDDWQQTMNVDKQSHGYSKRMAEEVAWKFIAESEHTCYDPENVPARTKEWIASAQRSCFDLAVINPAFTIGPLLNERVTSQSIMFFKTLLDGSRKKAEHDGVGVTDVRDVADAHVSAMAVGLSAASGALNRFGQARFLISTKRSYSVFEMAQLIKRAGFGQYAVPPAADGPKRPKLSFSNERARSVMGLQLHDMFDTIADTCESLVAHKLISLKGRSEL